MLGFSSFLLCVAQIRHKKETQSEIHHINLRNKVASSENLASSSHIILYHIIPHYSNYWPVILLYIIIHI